MAAFRRTELDLIGLARQDNQAAIQLFAIRNGTMIGRDVFLIDAAQTAGVVPIDIKEMNLDLVAFPGHKSLLGPTGTGALYVGPRASVRAWREGCTRNSTT